MREIRLSGSEGGGAQYNVLFLPPIMERYRDSREDSSGGRAAPTAA